MTQGQRDTSTLAGSQAQARRHRDTADLHRTLSTCVYVPVAGRGLCWRRGCPWRESTRACGRGQTAPAQAPCATWPLVPPPPLPPTHTHGNTHGLCKSAYVHGQMGRWIGLRVPYNRPSLSYTLFYSRTHAHTHMHTHILSHSLRHSLTLSARVPSRRSIAGWRRASWAMPSRMAVSQSATFSFK
jgi:hypothetical protein